MVIKPHLLFRPAVAMIELIFAIVVMGIVMMSAPQLISTATQSGYVAIQQEGINEAATQMNIILGYPWDENNTNEDYAPTVLNVTNGDGNLNGIDDGVSHKRRAGTPDISKRLYIRGDNLELSASVIGADGGDLDDMDDFNNTTVTLRQIQDAGASDYLQKGATITLTRTVNYMSDTAAGGTYSDPGADNTILFSPNFTNIVSTTNIKHIQVTLASNGANNVAELNSSTITLHAFSCNIGSYELEER